MKNKEKNCLIVKRLEADVKVRNNDGFVRPKMTKQRVMDEYATRHVNRSRRIEL